MLTQIFMIMPFYIYPMIVHSSTYNEYHEHRSEKMEEAIKRYSREANVEINEIKKKLFERKYAGEHSLRTISESKKFKYVVSKMYISIKIILNLVRSKTELYEYIS